MSRNKFSTILRSDKAAGCYAINFFKYTLKQTHLNQCAKYLAPATAERVERFGFAVALRCDFAQRFHLLVS
jgi:hypothetical protein